MLLPTEGKELRPTRDTVTTMDAVCFRFFFVSMYLFLFKSIGVQGRFIVNGLSRDRHKVVHRGGADAQ